MAVKLPVLLMELLGMLMVKVPPERVEVNREPVVLVATVMAACLPLKVDQSVEVRQPETEAEELGQLMTKALVEVDMLKILPAVPVETLLRSLTEPRPKVEVATKPGAAVPLDCKSWPAVPAKVERKVVPS